MPSLSQIWALAGTAPVSQSTPDSRSQIPKLGRRPGRYACTWEPTLLAPHVILRLGPLSSEPWVQVLALHPPSLPLSVFVTVSPGNGTKLLVLRVQFLILTCERRSLLGEKLMGSHWPRP